MGTYRSPFHFVLEVYFGVHIYPGSSGFLLVEVLRSFVHIAIYHLGVLGFEEIYLCNPHATEEQNRELGLIKHLERYGASETSIDQPGLFSLYCEASYGRSALHK